MRWQQCCAFAVMACVIVSESVLAFPQGNSTSSSQTSLFSSALRKMRLYDTSLQSSIIRLIRELMLTPKVYDNMSNALERRSDSGRVLFPGDSHQQQQQPRSASLIFASPSSRAIQPPSAMRAVALSSRTTTDNNNNANIYEEGGILRKGRAGKVERVPRPIIINGNSAAFNAPRYNRMLEGPAPTVGGSIKIPPPSVIVSQPLRIIEGNRDSRGRSLKEIDVQGVRVIVGQRVPDSPEDKLVTWRNGRVIQGIFHPQHELSNNHRVINREESNDISKPSSLVVSSSYNF